MPDMVQEWREIYKTISCPLYKKAAALGLAVCRRVCSATKFAFDGDSPLVKTMKPEDRVAGTHSAALPSDASTSIVKDTSAQPKSIKRILEA